MRGEVTKTPRRGRISRPRTASRIAAAVTVAAAAPIWMGANCSGSPRPEARQKTTSPSTGVKTGSMARPIPAVADRATIEHCRLSSAASVQTQTGVVFPSGDPVLRRLLHQRDQARSFAPPLRLTAVPPAESRPRRSRRPSRSPPRWRRRCRPSP